MGESMIGVREKVRNEINKMVADFLYYDRKEDEHLTLEDLNTAISRGEVTKDDLVNWFARELGELI